MHENSGAAVLPRFDPSPVLRRVVGLTHREAAVALGVSYGAVATWRQGRARISTYCADRIAVRLGHHPADLWPEWFDVAS